MFGVGPSLKRIVLFATRQEPASLEEPSPSRSVDLRPRALRHNPRFAVGSQGSEMETPTLRTALMMAARSQTRKSKGRARKEDRPECASELFRREEQPPPDSLMWSLLRRLASRT